MITKDDQQSCTQLIFRCFECKNNYKKDFNNELIKRFANIYEFSNEDVNKFILLLREGVYPYEYMDSSERLDETSLPDKEAFYSSLNMEDIRDVDHSHAKRVFKNLNNYYDYHDLYVQSDTLLLEDIFENFRNECTEIYELDPTHFLSAPGLEWQACLKKTEVKLELLTNVDILLIVEKGIRRGICHAIHRYAEANNKYMKKHQQNKESSYIQYSDASNLYGWAMSQKLTVDGFKWKQNMLKFDEKIKNQDEDSDKGYILEVDVEYPKNIHDLHSDLPFLPERMKTNKCSKLVCNLYDKNDYVPYMKSLKQALNHGLILKKVHRVIQFNQEAWLKEYIDMNTELRKEAKNVFEKNFFKLMNNSVFGKTMKNVRKHRDIKLVTTDKRRNQLFSEPNCHTTKWFSGNLLAIEMKKIKVKMNKPVYLDLSILEISKTLMYEFWYDYIKPKYKNNAKLCFMDTGSFIINIKQKISMKILVMMLKKDVIHQIMRSIDQYLKERIKK